VPAGSEVTEFSGEVKDKKIEIEDLSEMLDFQGLQRF